MTRKAFEAKAIREAERKLGLPLQWWGSYTDVHGPLGRRVRFSGNAWVFSINGKVVSKHDSRSSAIKKAVKSMEHES